MLGVSLWRWIGIAEPDEVPLCVKSWTFARGTCKYWGEKYRVEVEKDEAG